MSDEEQIVVELNTDHPLNVYIREATADMDGDQFASFMRRFMRTSAVRGEITKLGSLSKFRMRLVVRSLVAVFKAGYHAGHAAGYSLCERDAESSGPHA